MADGPRDHVVVGLEEGGIVLAALLGLRAQIGKRPLLEDAVQRARDVAADGRLLGDYQGLHQRSRVARLTRLPRRMRASLRSDTVQRLMVSPFYFIIGASRSLPSSCSTGCGQREGEPARKRRLRALGESPLQHRPLAAGAAAVAEAADPVHGEVRALPPAVVAHSQARRRVSGSAGLRRRGGDQDRGRPRARRARSSRSSPRGPAARRACSGSVGPGRTRAPPGSLSKPGSRSIPAAIAGTDRLLRMGPLRVVYGPPVELDDLGDGDVRKAARVATERLMTAIGDLEASL